MFVIFKIFLECLMLSPSLQLHVSDRPYNSMPRTFGLTRATEIGSRRLTNDTENFPKKNEKKLNKRKGFSKFGCTPEFRKKSYELLSGLIKGLSFELSAASVKPRGQNAAFLRQRFPSAVQVEVNPQPPNVIYTKVPLILLPPLAPSLLAALGTLTLLLL